MRYLGPAQIEGLLRAACQVLELVRTVKQSDRTPAIQMLDCAVVEFIEKYSNTAMLDRYAEHAEQPSQAA